MNSRIIDLLGTFGLNDRLTSRSLLPENHVIDYDKVEVILGQLRKKSIDWLTHSIEA